MNEFISINKTKFVLQFKVTVIATLIILLISLFGQHEKGFIILAIPLVTQLLMHLYDYIEFHRINKVLNSQPFDKLVEIGLQKSYSYRTSKWISAKPILIGSIDNYPVKCAVENGILRIISDTNLDLVEKSHMEELKSIFGLGNIGYDFLGIALLYSPSRRKDISFESLSSELKQFIAFLKARTLDPWDRKVK